MIARENGSIIVIDNIVYLAGNEQKVEISNGSTIQVKTGDIVKAGDVIEIREKSRSNQRTKDVFEVTAGRLTPDWIDVDRDAFKVVVENAKRFIGEAK